jgi:uncharacterized protein (DUF2384 family)
MAKTSPSTDRRDPFRAAIEAEARRAVMRRVADDRKPNEAEAEVRAFVTDYFGDEHKVEEWLTTPNPMLGCGRPRDLLRLGQHDKVLKFIRAAKQQRGRDGE